MRPDARVGRRLAGLGLFVGLAILHTWPLVTAPGTLSRNDNHDTVLNEWIVAWVAHQVATDPLRLFEANAFHPEPRSLAFGEHLFVPSLMASPLLWMGASPVLAYNLLLLAGFALTGWTMSLVIERWTGDAAAGVVAGAAAAFNAHTLTRLPHVQAIHAEFLPLALGALDLLLVRRMVFDAVRLAWWFVLQALSSGYLLVFTTVALAAGALARPREWRRRDGGRTVGLAAVAAALAVTAVLPFLLPYYRARHEQGMVRTLEETARFAAAPSDYLSTAARLHYAWWSEGFYRYDAASLFPGVVVTALAVTAVWAGALRDPRARMLAAAGAAGVVLSFGPAVPGFGTLYRVFPLLEATRNVSRFGYLGLFGLAGLAGFGLAEVRRRIRQREAATRQQPRAAGWLAIACVALVTLEALRAPMAYVEFGGIPAVYERLAVERDAVVAEFPFFEPADVSRNARYLLFSTRHWKPILNGYNGFMPASYGRHAEALRSFPAPGALAYLRRMGVTHVIVHGDADAETALAARNEPALVLEAEAGADRLYRLAAEE